MNQPIQTSEFWDSTAEQYAAGVESFTSRFCLDAVALAEIEPGMSVLDIACGPGAAALAAATAGAKVTAVDFSQAMVDMLRARTGDLAIEARQMDGQALDFPDDHFDRVISNFGIPLFPDWRAGLAEAARVLKPGGRISLGVGGNPYGFGPNHLFAQARLALWPEEEIATGMEGMAALSDPDRVTRELEDVGFRDVMMHERTHDIVLPANILSQDSPMIASNPLTADLDAERRAAVLAEANEQSAKWRDGDVIRMPSLGYIAVARKDAA